MNACFFFRWQENVDRNLVLAVSEQDDKLGKRLFSEKKKKAKAKDNMCWTGGKKKKGRTQIKSGKHKEEEKVYRNYAFSFFFFFF